MKLEEFRAVRQKNINFYGQISAADDHFVVMQPNGACYAIGENGEKQCEVVKWKGLRQIAAGDSVSAGLSGAKELISTDSEINGKTAVLKGITAVGCLAVTGHDCAVVTDDGRVVVLKAPNKPADHFAGCPFTNSFAKISAWKNVVSIAGSNNHIAALCNDGTVLAAGENNYGQIEVGSWKNIVQIAASPRFTVGLDENGRLHITGSDELCQRLREKTAHWRDMTYIDAAPTHIVALTENGTVMDTSDFKFMSSWKSMVMVAAGSGYTLGLHTSGKIYYSGKLPGKLGLKQKKSFVNFELINN